LNVPQLLEERNHSILDNPYTYVYSGYTDTDQEDMMGRVGELPLADQIAPSEVRAKDWITLVTVTEVDGKPVVTNRKLCMVESADYTDGVLTVSGPMNDGGLSREYVRDTVRVSSTSEILIKLIGRDGEVLGF
jgi:hypothetical protein